MRWIFPIMLAGAAFAQAPDYQPVGNMSQLMINIIYPASDALFYIERTPPKTDADWNVIRSQALMLAESGNLLMMPMRTREGGWNKEAKMMITAAKAAYKASLAKDMAGVLAQGDTLTESCIACHKEYRPNYGK
jgi:hypothetical protein